MSKPRGFQPCRELAWAALCERAPKFKAQRRSGRKLTGIKYEARVHEHFQKLYGDMYVPQLWIMFRERGQEQVRYAQLDALLFDFDCGTLTIVEVKYQHIDRAWWQLHHLYAPLVKHLFGQQWRVRCIEVVKWYDPSTYFPGPVKLCKTLDQAPDTETGVHIWRPTGGTR